MLDSDANCGGSCAGGRDASGRLMLASSMMKAFTPKVEVAKQEGEKSRLWSYQRELK